MARVRGVEGGQKTLSTWELWPSAVGAIFFPACGSPIRGVERVREDARDCQAVEQGWLAA